MPNNYSKTSNKIEKITIDSDIKKNNTIEWYNISNPQEKEINFLKKKYKFSSKDLRASLVNVTAQRPMIYNGSNYLFIIIHFPVMEDGKIVPSEIEFFIGHQFLITLHDGKTKAVKKFIKKIKEAKKDKQSQRIYKSSAILLYDILEQLIQTSYELLDEHSLEINRVEESIFESAQKSVTVELLNLKRSILNIRKIVQNHKNIIQKLTEMKSSIVPQSQIKNQYNVLVEHSHRIWEFTEIQKEMIDSLHNTSESISSYRTNKIITTLTVFSVLIMPANLFVNLFGMNLKPSPINANFNLFINILIINALISIALYIYFRKKRWL